MTVQLGTVSTHAAYACWVMVVDTDTLAVHLGVTSREVRRRVAAGLLVRLGRWRTGMTGRPRMWFDLDNLRGQLDNPAITAESVP